MRGGEIAGLFRLIAGIGVIVGLVAGTFAILDRVSGKSNTPTVVGPATFSLELKARAPGGYFSDSLNVRPGESFQLFLNLRNNGAADAAHGGAFIRLPHGLRLIPRSCELRSSDESGFAACQGNLTKSEFQWEQFGRGSWIQVYVAVKVSSRLKSSTTVEVVGTANSFDTPAEQDSLLVGIT